MIKFNRDIDLNEFAATHKFGIALSRQGGIEVKYPQYLDKPTYTLVYSDDRGGAPLMVFTNDETVFTDQDLINFIQCILFLNMDMIFKITFHPHDPNIGFWHCLDTVDHYIPIKEREPLTFTNIEETLQRIKKFYENAC